MSRFTASLSVFMLIFSFLISFHLPFVAASELTPILLVLKSSFGVFPYHMVHCCPNPKLSMLLSSALNVWPKRMLWCCG
jgi:hypothetical protein